MRYRFMATYLGVPYHAGLGPDGTEVTLFSPAPPPEDLGFTRQAGHWRKKVSIGDIAALWQSRLVGEYRGERCLVLDDLGDRLHIAYLGRDTARARQLGYWEIDREVFEVVVARQEVIGLAEERVDFPLAAATFPPSGNFPPSGAVPPSRTGPQQAFTGPQPAFTGPQPAFTGPQQAFTGPQQAFTGPQPAFTGPQPAVERTAPLPATGRGQPAAEQSRYERADRPAPTPDRMAAWHGSPTTEPWPLRQPPQPAPAPSSAPTAVPVPPSAPPAVPTSLPASAPPRETGTPLGRRTGRRDRVSPQSVFAELLTLAGIPQAAYAVDQEVPGAMCVIKAEGGFEVFSRTEDARLDVRYFEDEEAAYFYLFGVLAAEAVRSGRLGPPGLGRPNGFHNGSRQPGMPPASAGNVSKYLRCRKLPKLPPTPARVYLAGGADGPPLPKQPRRPPRPDPQSIGPIGGQSLASGG